MLLESLVSCCWISDHALMFASCVDYCADVPSHIPVLGFVPPFNCSGPRRRMEHSLYDIHVT